MLSKKQVSSISFTPYYVDAPGEEPRHFECEDCHELGIPENAVLAHLRIEHEMEFYTINIFGV